MTRLLMLDINGKGEELLGKKMFSVKYESEFCKGCNICVGFCPAKILYPTENAKISISDQDKCIGCKACENRCPDYAIKVEVRKDG